MAKAAGLEMPPTHLFVSKGRRGFFGVQRFDRYKSNLKIHVHTASGLLHADHRFPSLDYYNLIKAGWLLTRNIEDVLRKKYFKELAEKLSLTPRQINPIFNEVQKSISQWPRWAKNGSVSKSSALSIAKHLKQIKDNWDG